MKASKEKPRSWPICMSRMKKKRRASLPYFRSSAGLTMLPRDLLILLSSRSHQPWARMVVGRGRPMAMRKAGQYTAWKRRMSLPTSWRSGGQAPSGAPVR